MSKPAFAIRVVGVGGVGKSALAIRFINGSFDFTQQYIPTIEQSFMKEVYIEEVGDCTLDVLDTAGQEEYAALRDAYMKEGEGFLLVFSLAEKQSLRNLTEFYNQILMVKRMESVPMVLVGNKSDLVGEREVTHDDGLKKAREWGINYFECSAKDYTNVDECFYELVREIQKFREEHGFEGGVDFGDEDYEDENVYQRDEPEVQTQRCCSIQ